MKKNMWVVFLCLGVLAMAVPCASAEDDSALDQLQSIGNTGVVFDGSDGQRSGMDIDATPVLVPTPEPAAPVEPESAPVQNDPVETESVPAAVEDTPSVEPVSPDTSVSVDTTTYTNDYTEPASDNTASTEEGT